MRNREEIEQELVEAIEDESRMGSRASRSVSEATGRLQLEVLLDIRDLLSSNKRQSFPESAPPPVLDQKGRAR